MHTIKMMYEIKATIVAHSHVWLVQKMTLMLRRKLMLLCLLRAVVQRTAGQAAVGAQLPCEEPGEDPDPLNPRDNLALLSHFRSEHSAVLDGVNDCSGGSDEGMTLAIPCSHALHNSLVRTLL